MKSERSWAGIICGFVLFIVVCLSLLLHMKGGSGNPELGLLFFYCRGGGELSLPDGGCCVLCSARYWRRRSAW